MTIRQLMVGCVAAALAVGAAVSGSGEAEAATLPAAVECHWLVQVKKGHTVVNVRSGPGTKYRVVDRLKRPQRLFYRYTTNNGWYRVDDEGGGNKWYVSASVTTKVYECSRY